MPLRPRGFQVKAVCVKLARGDWSGYRLGEGGVGPLPCQKWTSPPSIPTPLSRPISALGAPLALRSLGSRKSRAVEAVDAFELMGGSKEFDEVIAPFCILLMPQMNNQSALFPSFNCSCSPH